MDKKTSPARERVLFYSRCRDPAQDRAHRQFSSGVKTCLADQVSDGTLCYWLNGESSVDPVWYQKLGEDMHPVFDSSRGIVYLLENGKYDNDPNGTGLNSININNVQAIYSLDGVKHTELQRGINVVRQKDGTLKKINVK